MRLDWDVTERDGVALVTLGLRNDGDEPRRVRVANRLDGPVWYPRTEGVPAAGWDDGGFEGVVDGGATRPLGYACPAPPAEPPAEVAWTERAAGGAGPTAADAVRTLGDPRPPRDVVAPSAPAVPPAVAAWLDAVERRATAGGDPADADARALAAVARRVAEVRR